MKISFFVTGLFLTSTLLGEGLSFAKIFTDHCVLQRDMAVPIWGWAAPGAAVSVRGVGAAPAVARAESAVRRRDHVVQSRL